MSRNLFYVSAFVPAILISPLVCLGKGESASKRKNADEANIIITKALEAESKGDLQLRAKLLSEADQLAKDSASKWHQGLVQDSKGKWVSIDAVFSTEDSKIAAYEQRRNASIKSVDSQMNLATWCIQQGLLPQARSHLSQVIQLDYNNARARAALGYRFINEQWVSPAELNRMDAAVRLTQEAYQKHGPAIQTIATNLESNNVRIRNAAQEKLDSLNDPAAIPAIEAVFHAKPQLAKQAIGWLANIDTVESSQALAKYALMSSDKAIRQLATDKLKGRPLHDVVPKLLEMMAAPATSTLVPRYDEQGSLIGYSQYVVKEGFEANKIEAVNTRLRTSGRNARGQRFLEDQMQLALEADTALDSTLPQEVTADKLREDNAALEERNRRIGTLVAAIGNTSYTGNVKDMWNWWDGHNETKYQTYKDDRYDSQNRDLSMLDDDGSGDGDDDPVGECFVAGTPVVTKRGMKSIETIQAGDMVLSRNVATGELAFRPVLRATNRPAEATRTITIGKETIQCTTGHLLWVSGSGWKKVSELKKGDILHGAQEPTVITKVVDSAVEVTYNLDVADFGTYFVGERMIMSHDVKPRSANRFTVPGLKMVSAPASARATK